MKDRDDFLALILFGVYGGFAACTHTSGLAFVALAWLLFVVFHPGGVVARLKKGASLAALILLFGSFFHLLNLVYGHSNTVFKIIHAIERTL